jgi:hypothetical protein
LCDQGVLEREDNAKERQPGNLSAFMHGFSYRPGPPSHGVHNGIGSLRGLAVVSRIIEEAVYGFFMKPDVNFTLTPHHPVMLKLDD